MFYREETEGPEDEVTWPKSHRRSPLKHIKLAQIQLYPEPTLLPSHLNKLWRLVGGVDVRRKDFSGLLTELLEDRQQDGHD